MSEFKKLPPQEIAIPHHPEYTHISLIGAPRSTLFLAFGTCLLESLNRLQSLPTFSQPIWTGCIELIDRHLEGESRYHQHSGVFSQLLSVLQKASQTDAHTWIQYYLENDYLEAATGVDAGIHLLAACANSSQAEALLRDEPFEEHKVLDGLCAALHVSTLLIDESGEEVYFNAGGKRPLLTLHRSSTGAYAVIYHSLHFQGNQSPLPPETLSQFPFMTPSGQKSAEDELILALCSKIVTQRGDDDTLRRLIDNAIAAAPELNSGNLRILRDRLN